MLNRLKALTFRHREAFFAFLLSMTLTAGATYFAIESSRLENRARFERTVANVVNTLKIRMTIYTTALITTRNLFDIKPNLSQSDFSTFIERMNLQEIAPGIQSIGYVERLSTVDAAKKLKSLNSNFEAAGSLTGATEHDLITLYQQILDGSTAFQGMDLASSAERKKSMNEARDTGFPVATGRVRPMKASSDSNVLAFLVFVPRYKKDSDTSSVEARRKNLLGFVYAGFRAPNFFGRVSNDLRMRFPNLAMRVYDGATLDPQNLMFSEGIFAEGSKFYQSAPFIAANHSWIIEIAAPEDFSLGSLQWSPFFVLALGSMLSIAVLISLLRSDRLGERLKAASLEAEKANRAKSMFLANMSHEIRTPLGIIMGFAESALTEERKEQRDSYLKTISRNGKELARIIGDVLDLSKIEAKTLMIEHNPVSLTRLNEELNEMWAQSAKKKNIKFQIEQAEGIPEYIVSDETRVKQILVNLISNAFKFTSEGSISVDVSKASEGYKEYLLYSVSDTGIGIPEENRKKLFKAFSQGDSSITRKFGGNGLGLAISKELAQALGGDLTVEPKFDGQGTRFVLKIPLIEANMSHQKKTTTPDEAEVLKGRKVLLVEDSLDNQTLVEMILKKYGVTVGLANNGQEGVDQALSNQYDLILMDIQMPILDGYAAFEKIKSNGIKTPVIALTAHALKDEKDRALEAGFAAYLTKPIDRAQLVKVSAQLLT